MTIDKKEVATNQDQKINLMLKVITIVLAAFLATGTGLMISFGSVKTKVEQHDADILHLQKRSVDVIFIQDLIQSNYMLVDILKSAPQSPEMEEALKKWKEFQISTMLRANPTRGGSQGGGSSSN